MQISERPSLAADQNFGLLDGVNTELYRAVHRSLSTIRNNGVSTFQGEVYTGRIGPIVGTLESVRIIEVSAFQECPQGGIPLYVCIVHACVRVCIDGWDKTVFCMNAI